MVFRSSTGGAIMVRHRRSRTSLSASRTRRSAPRNSRKQHATDVEPSVAVLSRERDEALVQQRAIEEVLKIISASPAELQAVLELVARSAARFCEADDVTISELDGQDLRMAAHWGSVPNLEIGFHFPCTRETVAGRTVLDRKLVHVIDLQAEAEDFPEGSANARRFGHRTIASVPLLREGVAIGTIALRRTEVNPFTDKQLALLETFAAQAVIAIENARLLSELRERTTELTESLEEQTASSEVLKVFSQSGIELTPVLDVLVATAARICSADSGFIFRLQDGLCQMIASFGKSLEYKDFQLRNPIVPNRGTIAGRVVLTRDTVHVDDASTDPEYTRIEAVELGHQRTMLGVPLVRDGALIGVLTLARSWVEPFTLRQIALVQNFATQAVIALENARLLRELRERTSELTESLEQQTATSEVLQVIASSPGELEPVIQAMLANATRLCEASYGAMWLREGDRFRNAAFHGPLPEAYLEQWRSATVSVTAPLGRVAQSRKPLQIADLTQDQTYHDGHPLTLTAVHIANIHTLAIVPMLKGDEFVGVIAIYRKEVRPFTDKQIELVQNFANQTVIAIEKARLLEELRQSLQQQTATSEVLRVISSSPGELEPVFEIMLQKAVRLCDAKFGILYLSEGNGFRTVAMHNVPPSLVQLRQNKLIHFPVDASVTRAAVTKQPCHQIDARTERSYIEGSDSQFVAAVNLGGMRTVVSVPMLKDDKIIGVITIYRQEVRPFTDRQIELVTTFADQVAIALENARLLSELRQRTTDLSKALDQQTATSEVLQSISSSSGELASVFQAILAHATRLCEAKFGSLYLRKEDAFRAVAMHGPSPIVEWLQREPVVELRDRPHIPLARVAQSKEVLHIRDLAADQAYIERDPRIVAVVELGGYRTVFWVPMLKEGELIGVIGIYRLEVRPFSDKQIELVQNFANQAVIAIESTRLLNELRRSLQQQTATADVLKVISRSTFDLKTVLQTLVESAARLCEADQATMTRQIGGKFFRAEAYSFSSEFMNY